MRQLIILLLLFFGKVFKGEEFHPLATLSANVPILSCSGLTKRFLVPGWRMGWILIHDRNSVFAPEARAALQSLSQRIIGSNTLVQGALPDILRNTPQSFFDDTIGQVQRNAEIAYEKLKLCPGLRPIKPKGAMYMMVGIDMPRYPDFSTEFQFVERLVSEQSVFCLPGKCFEYPDYFRIVLTVPEEQLLVALDRILEYCQVHYYPTGEDCPQGTSLVEDAESSSPCLTSEDESCYDDDVPNGILDTDTRGITLPNGIPTSYQPQTQATA